MVEIVKEAVRGTSVKVITYELPVRIKIEYAHHDEVMYVDHDDYYELVKEVAENDWNTSDMVQYLPSSLVSIVLDMKMDIKKVYDDSIVCHIICEVSSEFTDHSSKLLADYITGQMSDGWGEGFEQQMIDFFNYDEEYEEYDEESQEPYVELWEEVAEVFAEFWWSKYDEDRSSPWYIKQVDNRF